MYAAGLATYGFDIIAVAADDQAFPHLWAMHPDLIVLEVMLRHTDGWQLLRALKHDARTRDIPVIVLTSDAHVSARARADHEHCAEFLLKPCLPERVASGLRRVIDVSPDAH
jgi:two-component system cell cycle response regulator DivK